VGNPDEDGFREIQLNGKQLVFLFMAATVVLVVTFLTGVLVGRGVRAERVEAAQAEALTDGPATPVRSPEETTSSPDDDPRAAAPPSAPEEEIEPPVAAPRNPEPAPAPRVDATAGTNAATAANSRPAPAAASGPAAASAAPASGSRPASAPPPAANAAPSSKPAERAAATTTAPAAQQADVPSAPPSGPRNGYAVQVAAVNARNDAEAIVRRLSGKGYSAYVETPRNNASVFRVRVGTFRTRREAQTVADKLKREEKFKPWVTR
jgi:cell division septation protein DedD